MIETAANISFKEPFGALPGSINGRECAMASTFWPETMTAVGKLGFVKCLKDEPDDFLNQFICPCGLSQGPWLLRQSLRRMHWLEPTRCIDLLARAFLRLLRSTTLFYATVVGRLLSTVCSF